MYQKLFIIYKQRDEETTTETDKQTHRQIKKHIDR